MAVTTTNLGVITAYGDAVAAGYTGTKAEWQALMASYATVGQQAVDAKNAAVAAKDTAVAKATEATTAASTATTKANEASASAQSIAQSAAQIQENTDDIDQLKSELAQVINMEEIDDRTSLTFDYGQIHGSSYGNHSASSTTCFSLTKIKSSLFDKLTFNNTVYKVAFVGYAESGTYQNVGAWLTTSPVLLSTISVTGDFWCVQVRRQDGANLSDTDLTSINAVLHDITENKIITHIDELETAVYNVGYVDGSSGNDANDGSASAPFKTIMKAVNAKKQVINVKAGTYSEMVNLSNITYPISIRLWEMPKYDGAVEEAPKIVIDGGENRSFYYGILCNHNGDIELSDIHCKRTSETPFYIKRVKSVKCVRCIASNSASGKSGFTIENVNGEFIDCVAYDIAVDGFNIHGYGDTEFINCVAHDCGDDGISHHDGCTGHISGGEYYNCTKGGVSSPTYGAYIDMDGVYSHDNTYGLYSVSEDNTRRNTKSKISNCVFKNNSSYDLHLTYTVATMWNTLYDTKNVASTATLNEITS